MQQPYPPQQPAYPATYAQPQPGAYGTPPAGPQQYQQQYQPQQPGAYMNGPPAGYGPQNYGGPQMAGGGGTVIIVDQQQQLPGGFMGSEPSHCVCPQCHASIMTQVDVSPGTTSWLCCIGLCFVGAGPFALIPVR